MAYKLAIADTVGVNVSGSTRDANGAEQPFAFTLFCDRMKNDELVAWVTEPGRTANQFFREHAKGWRDQVLVLDEANQPAPFGPDALECLFSISGMAALCWQAYREQVVVEKN